MNNIIGGIALLSLAIPGFFLNSAVLKKERPYESLALSWLTGSVAFTLILYGINNLLGIPLNHQSSAITLAALTLISFILARKNLALPEINFKKNKFILIIAGIFAALMFVTAFFYPVADWDAITLFDFRARILLSDGFLTNKVMEMLYGGYPMYTSLLHFWTYVTGLSSPMPIYPLFTISLFAGTYFVLKRIFKNSAALLISLAVVLTPRIFANSFIAYTNLPYAAFIILGALYIYLFTLKRDWASLIIGVFLTASTFWVRSFPFALVNFALILLAAPFFNQKSKIFNPAYWTAAATAILVGLYFLPFTHDVANYLKWAVFKYYSPYWIIFVGIFIYKLVKRSKDWFWALAYIGYSLALFVGTYIFNKTMPGYYQAIPDALQRMMMFANASVILLASTLISPSQEE